MDAAIHPGGRSEQGLGFLGPPTWIPAEKSVPVRLWVLSSPLPAQVCPRPWGSWSPGLSADFLSIQASGDPPGVRGLPGEGRTLGPRGRPWLFILTPEQNEGGLQTRFFRPLIPHQHPAHPPSCWGWGVPALRSRPGAAQGGWNGPLNNPVKDVQRGRSSKTSWILIFFSFFFFPPEAEFVQHFIYDLELPILQLMEGQTRTKHASFTRRCCETSTLEWGCTKPGLNPVTWHYRTNSKQKQA